MRIHVENSDLLKSVSRWNEAGVAKEFTMLGWEYFCILGNNDMNEVHEGNSTFKENDPTELRIKIYIDPRLEHVFMLRLRLHSCPFDVKKLVKVRREIRREQWEIVSNKQSLC